MIEASVAPAADDSRVGKPVSLRADRPERRLRLSLPLAIGWLVFSAGLAWFILAGSVRVGSGHWLGQRLRVRVIWSRFLDFLVDHGANSLMVSLVVVTAILTLLGSLTLLWWVLGQRNVEPETPVTPDAS